MRLLIIFSNYPGNDASFLKIRCLPNNCEGMTMKSLIVLLMKCHLSSHNVIPFINDNLGRNKDKNYNKGVDMLKGTSLAGTSTSRDRVEDDYYATPPSNCSIRPTI